MKPPFFLQLGEAINDNGCPVHLPADLGCHLQQTVVGNFLFFPGHHLQELTPHLDGIQRLVQLVGHPGGNAAHGGHEPQQIPRGHQFHMKHDRGQNEQGARQGCHHGDHHEKSENRRGLEVGKDQDRKPQTDGKGGKDNRSTHPVNGVPQGPVFVQVLLEFLVVAHQVMNGIVHGETYGDAGNQAGGDGKLDPEPAHEPETDHNGKKVGHDCHKTHLGGKEQQTHGGNDQHQGQGQAFHQPLCEQLAALGDDDPEPGHMDVEMFPEVIFQKIADLLFQRQEIP